MSVGFAKLNLIGLLGVDFYSVAQTLEQEICVEDNEEFISFRWLFKHYTVCC